VPAGIERLSLHFDYDRADRTVIDLGLRDPKGLRGWSGGAKSDFTLATNDASSAYMSGPIIPGTWHLILGVPNIRKSVTASWKARIRMETLADAPPVSAFLPGPLKTAPGWYRGDFHTHTGHSDGSCNSLAGHRVPCPVFKTLEAAQAAGLDFIAVTDHNTPSAFSELRNLQPYFDTLLILPGREITTFQGHANAIGPTGPLDFQLGSRHLPQLSRLVQAVKAQGGILSINHPGMPSGEACMGCGWVVPQVECQDITAIEVANGGTIQTTGSAEGPLSSIPFWETQLDRGCRVTAIGGSDNHDPDAGGGRLPVGRPATLVYAEALSQVALLDGVRRGRVIVDLVGNPALRLDLTARSGDRTALMGEQIRIARGQGLVLTLELAGIPEGRIELVAGPGPGSQSRQSLTISGRSHFQIKLLNTDRKTWVRADVRSPDGRLIAISNPIYLQN
jgi:histidinol phosphatase-like PHP family hydrolase